LEEKKTAVNTTDKMLTDCVLCREGQSRLLNKILSQYQELAANGGWSQWKQGLKIVPGAENARIPQLRQILTITGDYPAASGVEAQSLQYDETLVTAVKHFQTRHGLNADGTLGRSTQAALSIPVETRISQIEATLTRLAQTSALQDTKGKFILVNLPAFTLYAVQDGKQAANMRVIVGNRKNHTPLFDNEVTNIVFNPPWHVPVRIARNEMIPKLRNNPDYFIKAGFTVTEDGQAIDPLHADPHNRNYHFVQQAGAGNALGKIKFNIPDNDDIYLHSTASPQLFKQEDRALSHGCIRLENPRALAYFVLEGKESFDKAKIDRFYDAKTERNVSVEAVPVHLVYWTAFVDETGTPHFYDDVYRKNESVQARIAPEKTVTVALK
jgi:murein L,D-transpeptidase YcbB/YkuD